MSVEGNGMKRDYEALIKQAIEMYRKGMTQDVINFGTGIQTPKWMPHITAEDRRIHDEYISKSKRIHKAFWVSRRYYA